MKKLYAVVKHSQGFDWEDYDTVCLVETEELAKSAVEWLEKNDEAIPDTRHEYYFYQQTVVGNMDEFIEFWES